MLVGESSGVNKAGGCLRYIIFWVAQTRIIWKLIQPLGKSIYANR